MRTLFVFYLICISSFVRSQNETKDYTYGYTTTAYIVTNNPYTETQTYSLSTGPVSTFNGNQFPEDSIWVLSIYRGDTVVISEFQDAYGSPVDYINHFTFYNGTPTNTTIEYLGNAGGNNLLVTTEFIDSAFFQLISDGLKDRKIKIVLLEDEIIDFISFNPLNNQAVIKTGFDEEIEVKLYSITGQIIEKWLVNKTLTIDMSSYSEHLYFFKAEINNQLITRKIINY